MHAFCFENKTAVVTGGAHGIGRCISEEFARCGAKVHVIDIAPGDHYVGDISDPRVLEDFVAEITAGGARIDYLINNALPEMHGINDSSWEQFNYLSSTRDRMSQPQTESYTAAKGGIAALTHALAVSLAGRVRVNSISPGWIDTAYTVYEGPDATQQPAGRVGNPLDIANLALYLCSDMAGFITGENICVDGGMTKQMIYHNDWGWRLEG